jgi:hypothetical protein
LALKINVPKLDRSRVVTSYEHGNKRPPCYNTKEVVEYFDVSKSMFNRMREENLIPEPHFYVGNPIVKAYWQQDTIHKLKNKVEIRKNLNK